MKSRSLYRSHRALPATKPLVSPIEPVTSSQILSLAVNFVPIPIAVSEFLTLTVNSDLSGLCAGFTQTKRIIAWVRKANLERVNQRDHRISRSSGVVGVDVQVFSGSKTGEISSSVTLRAMYFGSSLSIFKAGRCGHEMIWENIHIV